MVQLEEKCHRELSFEKLTNGVVFAHLKQLEAGMARTSVLKSSLGPIQAKEMPRIYSNGDLCSSIKDKVKCQELDRNCNGTVARRVLE